MMQGDCYNIPFDFYDDSGNAITESDCSDMEITIGTITKRKSDNELTYNVHWLFPVTQAESFKLFSGRQPVQARVKFGNGNVIGCDMGLIDVEESISKGVI